MNYSNGEFIIVFLFAVALICAIAFVCKLKPISIFGGGGKSSRKNKSGKSSKSDPRVIGPSQPMSWELLL
jgi:hypothetical protein